MAKLFSYDRALERNEIQPRRNEAITKETLLRILSFLQVSGLDHKCLHKHTFSDACKDSVFYAVHDNEHCAVNAIGLAKGRGGRQNRGCERKTVVVARHVRDDKEILDEQSLVDLILSNQFPRSFNPIRIHREELRRRRPVANFAIMFQRVIGGG
jgi:hypothetical protein